MNVVLPRRVRLITYVVLACIVGLILPGAAVWYTSVGLTIPVLLMQIQAVASFVASAPLVLAALNINKSDPLVNTSEMDKTFDPDAAPVADDEPDEPDADPTEPEVDAVLTQDVAK